jgi:hypothetical protein
MTETPTPPRRRWYRFGLGEMLALVTLLAIVWWHAVTQSTTQSFNLGVGGEPFVFDGRPSGLVASIRGTVWSVGAIGVWIVAIAGWRRYSRRSPP